MSKQIKTIRPGGRLANNFNRILAYVGLGWFASMIIVRYVIKPLKTNSRMKENESLMNYLYEKQKTQQNMKEFDT